MQVLYEHGVERSTLADIARAAQIPVGNVYYHFKTKDALISAVLAEHRTYQETVLRELSARPDPRERLKGLVDDWMSHRDAASRRGCPTATLATELGKREDDALALEARVLYVDLLAWIGRQFEALGAAHPRDSALSLVSRYEGMSVLAHVLRDPDVIVRQGEDLSAWLDQC
ncbi:TetR/AcrR family transcriptional regulator [Amnibacterium setariae]|uniref:TetR/AcrR family transcriptional regulator n=2 Tax=Amnibacterium setariae TaxID=2306585 RepID=A0A3A1TZ67_9MICO|nr:TetR/AcrR family transcriptional regulator [Amnibacterium setariae]